MKKLLFTFSLFLFTFYSYSQIVFNKIDTLYYHPTTRNLVIQNNNYFSVGGSSIDNILGVTPCKYDLNGNLIEAKYYADTIDWLHGIENSLTETGTGNYILGGNRGQAYFRDNLLIKFDSNFDTIFTKKYYPVDDNGYKDVLIWGSNIDVDGNYLLVGQTNIDNNYDSLAYYNMQLLKIDTFGNLLWRKIYGNSTYKYYGYKVTTAFDGGYILGGWSSKNGGDNCIIKTDENGDNPIFKYFGHPSYGDGRIGGITKTIDSCYIITSFMEITSGGLDKAYIYKL